MTAADVSDWPRSPLDLWPWLRNLLGASMALQFVNIAFTLRELGAPLDPELVTTADIMWGLGQMAFVVIYTVTFLLVAIYTCRATYRMMKNLHVLQAPNKLTGPAMAVWCYFIPIVSLYMPFHVMKQIWRGTFHFSPGPKPRESMIGWWWWPWIAANIAVGVSLIFAIDSGVFDPAVMIDADAYRTSLYIDLAVDALSIVATWFMIKTFATLIKSQDEILRAGIAVSPRPSEAGGVSAVPITD